MRVPQRGNPDDKPYAVIAGEKALAGHYERMGIKAEVEYTGCPVVSEPTLP